MREWKSGIVSKNHPVVTALEKASWKMTVPADTEKFYRQRLLSRFQNGPREMFDARYVTMPKCCLLGMKMRPKQWPMTTALSWLLMEEMRLAESGKEALAAELSCREGFHLHADTSVILQLWIGATVMVNAEPITVLYRTMTGLDRDRTIPTKADVVAALCGAHLKGHGTGALAYCRIGDDYSVTVKAFHVKRNREMYEAVLRKLHQLQQGLQSGRALKCVHEGK